MTSVNYLTQNDVDSYGHELLDLTQRSALHALAPELQDIRNQNAELQRRLAKESRHRLDQAVEAAIPNYRQIDRNPDWHSWLCGIDVLSGEIRQRLLNAAIQRGDSSSVIAFFRKFQSEAGGAQEQASAPGRTRTASSGRQIYSREMIAELYEKRRKGEFKDEAWNRIEQDIFKAQHESRIVGPDYLTK